jgi:hypothetical protein
VAAKPLGESGGVHDTGAVRLRCRHGLTLSRRAASRSETGSVVRASSGVTALSARTNSATGYAGLRVTASAARPCDLPRLSRVPRTAPVASIRDRAAHGKGVGRPSPRLVSRAPCISWPVTRRGRPGLPPGDGPAGSHAGAPRASPSRVLRGRPGLAGRLDALRGTVV